MVHWSLNYFTWLLWYSIPKIKHFWTTDPAAGSPVVSKVKARPRNVKINSFVFEQYSPGCVAPNEESIWDKVGVTFMASEMPFLNWRNLNWVTWRKNRHKIQTCGLFISCVDFILGHEDHEYFNVIKRSHEKSW